MDKNKTQVNYILRGKKLARFLVFAILLILSSTFLCACSTASAQEGPTSNISTTLQNNSQGSTSANTQNNNNQNSGEGANNSTPTTDPSNTGNGNSSNETGIDASNLGTPTGYDLTIQTVWGLTNDSGNMNLLNVYSFEEGLAHARNMAGSFYIGVSDDPNNNLFALEESQFVSLWRGGASAYNQNVPTYAITGGQNKIEDKHIWDEANGNHTIAFRNYEGESWKKEPWRLKVILSSDIMASIGYRIIVTLGAFNGDGRFVTFVTGDYSSSEMAAVSNTLQLSADLRTYIDSGYTNLFVVATKEVYVDVTDNDATYTIKLTQTNGSEKIVYQGTGTISRFGLLNCIVSTDARPNAISFTKKSWSIIENTTTSSWYIDPENASNKSSLMAYINNNTIIVKMFNKLNYSYFTGWSKQGTSEVDLTMNRSETYYYNSSVDNSQEAFTNIEKLINKLPRTNAYRTSNGSFVGTLPYITLDHSYSTARINNTGTNIVYKCFDLGHVEQCLAKLQSNGSFYISDTLGETSYVGDGTQNITLNGNVHNSSFSKINTINITGWVGDIKVGDCNLITSSCGGRLFLTGQVQKLDVTGGENDEGLTINKSNGSLIEVVNAGELVITNVSVRIITMTGGTLNMGTNFEVGSITCSGGTISLNGTYIVDDIVNKGDCYINLNDTGTIKRLIIDYAGVNFNSKSVSVLELHCKYITTIEKCNLKNCVIYNTSELTLKTEADVIYNSGTLVFDRKDSNYEIKFANTIYNGKENDSATSYSAAVIRYKITKDLVSSMGVQNNYILASSIYNYSTCSDKTYYKESIIINDERESNNALLYLINYYNYVDGYEYIDGNATETYYKFWGMRLDVVHITNFYNLSDESIPVIKGNKITNFYNGGDGTATNRCDYAQALIFSTNLNIYNYATYNGTILAYNYMKYNASEGVAEETDVYVSKSIDIIGGSTNLNITNYNSGDIQVWLSGSEWESSGAIGNLINYSTGYICIEDSSYSYEYNDGIFIQYFENYDLGRIISYAYSTGIGTAKLHKLSETNYIFYIYGSSSDTVVTEWDGQKYRYSEQGIGVLDVSQVAFEPGVEYKLAKGCTRNIDSYKLESHEKYSAWFATEILNELGEVSNSAPYYTGTKNEYISSYSANYDSNGYFYLSIKGIVDKIIIEDILDLWELNGDKYINLKSGNYKDITKVVIAETVDDLIIDPTNIPAGITDTDWFGINGFNVEFDGRGQTIELKNTKSGLFNSLTTGAYVHDLNITGNIEFTTTSGTAQTTQLGALSNYASGMVSVLNVKNYANISATLSNAKDVVHVGGLIGKISGIAEDDTSIDVTNCANFGNITLTSSITLSGKCSGLGGIIGSIGHISDEYFGTSLETSGVVLIDNCYHRGVIIGKRVAIGGIVGTTWCQTLFCNCISNGYMCIESNKAAESSYLGGIVGNSRNNYVYYYNCLNYSVLEVVSVNVSMTVAGIAGTATVPAQSQYIYNCYNFGDIIVANGSSVVASAISKWFDTAKTTGHTRTTNTTSAINGFNCNISIDGVLVSKANVSGDFADGTNLGGVEDLCDSGSFYATQGMCKRNILDIINRSGEYESIIYEWDNNGLWDTTFWETVL